MSATTGLNCACEMTLSQIKAANAVLLGRVVKKVLRDAAQAVTDERADVARKNVIELFDNTPWLADAETAVPGCLNLRYCDLYALAVLTAQPQPDEAQSAAVAPHPITDAAAFELGDCRAVHLGEVRLDDGRVFNGVVLEFPAGPPKLPIS